jgi:hypothetical protein
MFETRIDAGKLWSDSTAPELWLLTCEAGDCTAHVLALDTMNRKGVVGASEWRTLKSRAYDQSGDKATITFGQLPILELLVIDRASHTVTQTKSAGAGLEREATGTIP